MVTRKNAAMALAGAGLLVVGLVAGLLLGGRMTAAAAGGTPRASVSPDATGVAKYCEVYEAALANNLHVSTGALEQANLGAIQQTLDQLVKDGQLTAFEEAQIMQLAQTVGQQPCTHLNAQSLITFLQKDPALVQQFTSARTTLVGAVEKALGLSDTAFQAELAKGQTVAQVAKARNVPLATVSGAYLAAAQSLIAQAVSSGEITQAQADALAKVLAGAVNGGHFPLVEFQLK